MSKITDLSSSLKRFKLKVSLAKISFSVQLVLGMLPHLLIKAFYSLGVSMFMDNLDKEILKLDILQK